MNRIETSFWLVLRKTFWNFISRHDTHGSWWFRARPILFFAVLFLFFMFVVWGKEAYFDFSTPFPTEKNTHIEEGNIMEIKRSRQYFLELETKKSQKIIFRHTRLFGAYTVQGMFFENGHRIKRFGKVRYFILPSGKAWIVELWIEGKKYINEKNSKEDFLKYKGMHAYLYTCIGLLVLLVFMIISEYRYVKKSLIEEKNNG